MVVCNSCGGSDIEKKAWVTVNDQEYVEDLAEGDDIHCNDCGDSADIEEKDIWDTDNRCSHCEEISNDATFNCECSHCVHCDKNMDAEECECEICDECDCLLEDCECEDKDEEGDCVTAMPIAVPTTVQTSPTGGDMPIAVGPGIIEQIEDTGMAKYKCHDCGEEYEAMVNLTMCIKCLSDNIKTVE
jgi:hypothetical protein